MAEIVKTATLKNPAFWVCLTLSIILGIAGFIVPPMGNIDGSVLTYVGIMFAFAALGEVHVAIKKGMDARVRHGKIELAVGDLENGKEDKMNNRLVYEGEDDYE